MSNTTGKNLQASFLTILCSDKVPVAIYLVSGIKLQGVVTSFDTDVILLKHDNVAQMIYKHSVSTIVPSKPVEFTLDEEA